MKTCRNNRIKLRKQFDTCNVKKKVPIKIQETYRTTDRLDQKFPATHNHQNTKCSKQRIFKTSKEKTK